ncbi:hypothetical protein TNCV_1990651 [Trichonephila clavipes]|nr:hypothetical protein TNCV_1990651 [Trichonephila clavipes]
MKSLIYASPVDFNKALVARIAIVAGDIREMPGCLLMFDSPFGGGELRTRACPHCGRDPVAMPSDVPGFVYGCKDLHE